MRKKIILVFIAVGILIMALLIYANTRPKLILMDFENVRYIEISLQIGFEYENRTITMEEELRFLYDNIYQLSKKDIVRINRRPSHDESYQSDPYIAIRIFYKNDIVQAINIGSKETAFFFLKTRGSSGDPGFAIIRDDEIVLALSSYVEELVGYKSERFNLERD